MRLPLCILGLLALTAASVAARDVNQPVKRGRLEMGTGYAYTRVTGYFDSTGTYTRNPGGAAPAAHTLPMRAKFGVGGGLDLRFEAEYYDANPDANNVKGVTQPRLGLRYIRPLAGVMLTYTPPVALGDFDKPGLTSDVEIAGLLRKKTENYRFTVLGGYGWNSGRFSRYRLSFTPTYLWGEGIEMYSTVEYARGIELDAYQVTLTPGLRMDLSKEFYLDANFPHSPMGRSAPPGVAYVGWTARLIGYWTPGR